MAYLLDTDIAIHLRERTPAVVARIERLDRRPLLSVVTRVELEGGVYAGGADSARRRAAVDALLRFLPVVEFDGAMAAAYGRILADRGFSRRKVLDRMIAATALSQELILITANAADFADIAGLQLEIWDQ